MCHKKKNNRLYYSSLYCTNTVFQDPPNGPLLSQNLSRCHPLCCSERKVSGSLKRPKSWSHTLYTALNQMSRNTYSTKQCALQWWNTGTTSSSATYTVQYSFLHRQSTFKSSETLSIALTNSPFTVRLVMDKSSWTVGTCRHQCPVSSKTFPIK